jgi:hypothetical protein
MVRVALSMMRLLLSTDQLSRREPRRPLPLSPPPLSMFELLLFSLERILSQHRLPPPLSADA